MTTLEDLQAALEKTDAQCVTIYRSGTSILIGARWSGQRFASLPELSAFVAEVNRPCPSVSSVSSPCLAVNPS